ncbi:MAG: quinolinate synthase NadA [Dehalococcoidales bacterium]|nr:quinolinate synthase NadA [Dehalococcoidales bacterium]
MENKKNELAERIQELKKEKNAVILAHNYQPADIQDMADFVGDSLELSQKAASTAADVIVFCGVHFMAETASILSPDKKVLLPESSAGCPMADMVTAEKLRARKKELPGAAVVTYINSTAAVKAESDICCTSSNAPQVVASLLEEEILFVPDMYLGQYVASMVPNKKYHFWPGFCPVHEGIKAASVLKLKEEYPSAKVVVHPECRPEVIALADEVLSTSGMCRYAAHPDVNQMIVVTETGIIHRMQKENPQKQFIPVSDTAICRTMKSITLEKVLRSLETFTPEVKVPEDIRLKAIGAVNRMLYIV